MNHNEKKALLIEELNKERMQFLMRGQSSESHDAAIEYLTDGYSNHPPYMYDLLDAAIEDFDCLCSDYGIN